MRLSIQYQIKWDMNDIHDHNSIGHIDLQFCIECEDSILMIGDCSYSDEISICS